MKISVSIVHYKVPELLLQSIYSIHNALEGIESEIIVVDNASDDNSEQLIKTHFPEIKWIQNTENVGFGKAHNQAIAKAKGEFIAIVNPDLMVSPDTFRKVLSAYENLENAGIIGVQMQDSEGRFLQESKRNLPTILNALEKEVGLHFLAPNQSYYARQIENDAVGSVPVISGAFIFLPKAAFEDLGGFDERYFMYAEDIDLSRTSIEKGYTNYYLGNVVVQHLKGQSASKNPESRRYFYETMKQYIDKYYTNPLQKFLYKSFVDASRLLSKFKA